jgi:arginine deiminase
MAGLGVYSEVGRLKTVLMHRPGRSLERLTPQNRSEYLFDDVVWVERAQREHDDFTGVLRDRGVEVLYLQQLLAETLEASRDARNHIVERAVSSFTVGLSLVEELRGWLFAQTPDRLAEILVGGLLISELDGLDLAALNRHSLGALMATAVLARAAPRGLQRFRDIPPPSTFRGRRVRLLVSAVRRLGAVRRRGLRPRRIP